MIDLLLDDVKELLFKQKGDAKVLQRIKHALENDEVVSIYERGYVEKLVTEHLRPVVDIPNTPQNKIIPTYQIPAKRSKIKRLKFKPNKMIIVIIAILVISGIVISQYESFNISPPKIISGLSIETDSNIYQIGDIISVSGVSQFNTGVIVLSIIDSSGGIIWSEQVKVKQDGVYTTLVIAGGQGWDIGEYTITAVHESLNAKLIFSVS